MLYFDSHQNNLILAKFFTQLSLLSKCYVHNFYLIPHEVMMCVLFFITIFRSVENRFAAMCMPGGVSDAV